MRRPQARGNVVHDAETWRTMDECWRAGDLLHLLDANQAGMHGAIHASPVLQYVVQASRKIGKSYMLAVVAFEACLRNPGKRVNYAAPSGKECVEMTLPIMTEVAALAPEDCKPEWMPSKGHWEFPNGAYIVLFGADDEAAANRGRGPESILNIVDEGAFCPVLFYLVESVLAPQTLQTNGRTILASTPPVSPGHDWVVMAEAAASHGAYLHRDIYSHGRMTRAQIDAYLTQRALSRGLTLEAYRETTDFKREYMAQTVLDSTLAVVPEFPAVKDAIVKEVARPPFFDLLIAGDPGMDDFTGILFAVSDFKRNKLVIEHELLLTKANTQTIADSVRDVLVAHYPDEATSSTAMRVVLPSDFTYVVKPHSAVIDDASKRICADLWNYHGLSFSPAAKDDSEAAINVMRLEVAGKNIEINPRCVHLIRQLSTAVRKAPGGDMARSKRDGHYDLVAALKYLVRSWDKTHNPYPVDWNFNPHTMGRREPPPRRTLSTALLAGTSLGRRR